SPSTVGSSSVWWTAHHTIHRIPAIGILSANISQMKVQVIRGRGILLPPRRLGEPGVGWAPVPTRGRGHAPALGAAHAPPRTAPASRSAAQLDRSVAEMRHTLELRHAARDLLAGQPRDALGAELL